MCNSVEIVVKNKKNFLNTDSFILNKFAKKHKKVTKLSVEI